MNRVQKRLRGAVRVVDAHAFELLFSVLALGIGLVEVIGSVSPVSVEVLLSDWAQLLWGLVMVGGGSLVVSGIAARTPFDMLAGFSREKAGLFLLMLGYGVYAIALAAVNGWSSYAVCLFMLVGSVACWRRRHFLDHQAADVHELRCVLGEESTDAP